jgi:hypothetical protein
MAQDRKPDAQLGDYEVGYGRPPRDRQFQTGQPSANPDGRRGKSRSASRRESPEPDFLDELIPVKVGGRQRRIPRGRYLNELLFKEACGGELRATELLFRDHAARRRLAAKRNDYAAYADASAEETSSPDEISDAAIIARALDRRARREALAGPIAADREDGDE